jgi:hypothetical protein
VSKRRDGWQDNVDFACQMMANGTPELAGINDGIVGWTLDPAGAQAGPGTPVMGEVGSAEDNAFALPLRVTPNGTGKGCKVGTMGQEQVQAARLSTRWMPNDTFEFNVSYDITDENSESPWDQFGPRDRAELRRHYASWQFSQFLHGEQGAMVCAARIVESVPDLDSKFYSATQTMDEARHAEMFGRFLQEKIGMMYPINDQLQSLLKDTLNDSRWDMPYLGMQVLIEGLALAAFGLLRDTTAKPLPNQLLSYVMQDEARHVAFGRMALRDYYSQLTQAELDEREDFVIEGCYLMRDRLRGHEVLENFGIAAQEAFEIAENSPYLHLFRRLLFSRIVPCVKDIGLWSEKLQRAYVDMGVFELGESSLDDLMRQDEELAEQLDAQRFAREETARREEVAAAIADGAASG